MRIWLWSLRRHYQQRLEAAQREADKSARLADETRERVIQPLRRHREQNHYADLISKSLGIGYRQPGR